MQYYSLDISREKTGLRREKYGSVGRAVDHSFDVSQDHFSFAPPYLQISEHQDNRSIYEEDNSQF